MKHTSIVFPGSFDPITNGHVDLVKRVLPIFDKVYVAIGVNNQKATLFDLETRKHWLKKIFADEPKVVVDHFEGLTVKFCEQIGSHHIIRGLRNGSDFDYEKTISQLNSIIGKNVETLFLISKPEFNHISSTIVREIIKGGGDVGDFVPKIIADDLIKKFENGV